MLIVESVNGATLKEMPVPIHRFPADKVNEALNEYMGITLDDLSGVGMDELIYLAEYDAYYNFTSDAGVGAFVCTRHPAREAMP